MLALEIKNVSKLYGEFKALNNINFNIKEGDFVGLLGMNGAGKTTLISAIAGLNKFDGIINVMGYDVKKDLIRARRSIGVVPQEIAFDPFLTVIQTLKLQAGLYGVKADTWISELLERMHLNDKADSNVRSLSGGMKRRLMVAQALVHKPGLIILDEPTAGVDVEIRKSLWGFIRELHKKGHTILLTTHYLEEVEELCNKIVMINKGDIVSETGTKELMQKSSHILTKLEIEVMDKELNKSIREFTLSDNDELLTILTSLKESNLKIEDIKIIRPSLEDIFINQVKQ
jgi:ABC-2 type transport system ATP-binding protein